MNKHHPNYDAILAWAEGKPIQWKSVHGVWVNFTSTYYDPDFRGQWRPKPQVVKYRRYLSQYGAIHRVWTHNKDNGPIDIVEKQRNFVRWIDNEWIEEEV